MDIVQVISAMSSVVTLLTIVLPVAWKRFRRWLIRKAISEVIASLTEDVKPIPVKVEERDD